VTNFLINVFKNTGKGSNTVKTFCSHIRRMQLY